MSVLFKIISATFGGLWEAFKILWNFFSEGHNQHIERIRTGRDN